MRIPALFAAFLMVLPAAWADSTDGTAALQHDVQDLKALVSELQRTVQAQQQRIAELERGTVQAAAAPLTRAVAPSQALERQAASSLSAFNPEIGALVDVVGQFSESSAEGEGNDKLSAREMELVLGHPVDPYSRLDATIAFSDFEAASLEEAYLTHWGLPGELKARIGRLRPKIGKANPLHRDSLETVDEPRVIASYLGAEGLSRTGVELSGFLPAPWTSLTHEVIAGVMEGGIGEGGTLFGSTTRRPSLYARLRNSWDFSDASTLELGTTYATGSQDADSSFEVAALGLDATVTHFLTPTNKLKWQNELLLQDRDEAFSMAEDGTRTEFDNQPFGWYSLLDYRLSPRLGLGGRFDYVEPVDTDPALLARDADTAWSGYLTFYQSEFSRWRLQFRHTDFALGGDDNTVFAQATVAIGVHKHQLQ